MSLSDLQKRVHVAKDKHNKHGGFNYRTAEGILAAIKAELGEGDSILVTDDLVDIGGRVFVKSIATVSFAAGSPATATGYALHPMELKGMSPMQITGAASSYARKYALGGLVALDDGSADPDGKEPVAETPAPPKDQPTPEKTRDKIKVAIAERDTTEKLEALWKHPKTTAAIEKLPPPMQAELQKAYTDKMADVFKASDDMREYE